MFKIITLRILLKLQMLQVLGILMIVSAFAAAPAPDDIHAKIDRYENENDGTGNYHFSFETSNGISREETGTVVNRGQPDEHVKVRGNYKYLDEDGIVHAIYYSADKDGFQIIPEGDVTPVRPDLGPQPITLPGAAVASLLG